MKIKSPYTFMVYYYDVKMQKIFVLQSLIAGCFSRINKVFSGKLDAYLQELNDYLYDDGGETA